MVALTEEFRELFSFIQGRQSSWKDPVHGLTYYVFESPGPSPYRCVATFVGAMGEGSCGLLTDRMLTTWDPAAVVMLGIAGGLHKDVQVGDVLCASQIDSYLESAKAVAGEAGAPFTFGRSGDVFRPSGALLQDLLHLEFQPDEPVAAWQRAGTEDLAKLLPAEQREALQREGLVGEAPRFLDGHLASGPVVGAAAAFTRWLHGRDRAYRALDMESGGLLRAAQGRPAQTLVLRGISDLADERKAALERIGAGALRRYAMRNATRLLFALLGAGILPRKAAAAPQATAAPQPSATSPGTDRAGLRARLQREAISDSDLDAFCLDNYPDVYRRFSNGMDRIQKVNVLLAHVDGAAIERQLGPAPAITAGPRSVVIPGSVTNSVIVTGDGNKVTKS